MERGSHCALSQRTRDAKRLIERTSSNSQGGGRVPNCKPLKVQLDEKAQAYALDLKERDTKIKNIGTRKGNGHG